MSALFGYYGKPLEGLIETMASQLQHRCKKGYEYKKITYSDKVVEIGHGLANWQIKSQIMTENEKIMAYNGYLFENKNIKEIFNASIEENINAITGAYTLVQAEKNHCFLARDHAGIKVIYWSYHQERLVFASEIKALFADPLVKRTMRKQALLEYFTFSFIPGENTMFEGIYELQPGHLLKFSNNKIHITRYFYFENQENLSQENLDIAPVQQALQDSIQQCCNFNSASPPAVFLSGGIDSSSVLALANQFYKTIPTFSVHFGKNYNNENEFIDLMVKRYQTEHYSLEIKPNDFIDKLQEIIWHLDDPIGDPVTMPNYLMAEKASRISNFILNGEGGDPCFGGPKNIPMLLSQLYGPLPKKSNENFLERTYLYSFQRGYRDLPDLLLNKNFSEAHLINLLKPFFHSEKPKHFINKLMHTNIRLKGANLILVKVDKMTSSHGLIALAPLFTKAIIEASFQTHPRFKLHGSIEKYVLKQAVKDLIPIEIIQRPKSGMMVPVHFWMQKQLRGYIKKVLSPKTLKQQEIFNPDYVKKLLSYDIEGVPGMQHGLKLWMLMTFSLWYQQMVEAPIKNFNKIKMIHLE